MNKRWRTIAMVKCLRPSCLPPLRVCMTKDVRELLHFCPFFSFSFYLAFFLPFSFDCPLSSFLSLICCVEKRQLGRAFASPKRFLVPHCFLPLGGFLPFLNILFLKPVHLFPAHLFSVICSTWVCWKETRVVKDLVCLSYPLLEKHERRQKTARADKTTLKHRGQDSTTPYSQSSVRSKTFSFRETVERIREEKT